PSFSLKPQFTKKFKSPNSVIQFETAILKQSISVQISLHVGNQGSGQSVQSLPDRLFEAVITLGSPQLNSSILILHLQSLPLPIMAYPQRKVELVLSKDWDSWFTIIKAKAHIYEIWDLISPDLNVKPRLLPKPKEFWLNKQNPTSADMEVFNFENKVYKSQWAAWKEQKDSLSKIQEFILDTCGSTNLKLLQYVDPTPWDLLRALKLRMAPSDSPRQIELEKSVITASKRAQGNRQHA
ncbi:MAG: hypothetical protein Q9212_007511, partial [Teloschistes hypoglaucus]